MQPTQHTCVVMQPTCTTCTTCTSYSTHSNTAPPTHTHFPTTERPAWNMAYMGSAMVAPLVFCMLALCIAVGLAASTSSSPPTNTVCCVCYHHQPTIAQCLRPWWCSSVAVVGTRWCPAGTWRCANTPSTTLHMTARRKTGAIDDTHSDEQQERRRVQVLQPLQQLYMYRR